MANSELLVLAIILLVTALMLTLVRQMRRGKKFGMRVLPPVEAFRRQVGLAVESGRPPYVTLGRGGLHTPYGPVSVAALEILRHVDDVNGRSGLTARASVGEATLLPAVHEKLRDVNRRVEPHETDTGGDVRFLADAAFPFVYAAGVTEAIEGDQIGNCIAAGHFGSEIALIAEAAQRNELGQVMATDDPVATALATAASPNVLWGEELFASAAYLEGDPVRIASLRAQDIARWILAAIILGLALFRLL